MKNKEKDLFDLFRESAHKLEEQPPERVWQKLNRRLNDNKHAHRKKTVNLRKLFQLAAVAAVGALLVVVAGYLFEHTAREAALHSTAQMSEAHPAYLEDLAANAEESLRKQREIHLLYRRYEALK